MATNRVRAAACRISWLHQRFAGCFGRRESQSHSRVYLRGLMLAEGRKNAEAIALQFAEPRGGNPVGQNEVLGLQSFLTESPWNPSDIQREIQAVFDWRRWCIRRLQLCETRFGKCWREAAVVRPAWKDRELPGRRVSYWGDARRLCGFGPAALSAAGMGEQ